MSILDICLIADSAADLQRMLSVSQKFADESSFQFSMEKSQVVVFGPDAGDRFADEFRLMGTLMDVVGTSAQNEIPFGLSPASIFGRSNVDHAQRYVPLLWSRLRDDYTYYF